MKSDDLRARILTSLAEYAYPKRRAVDLNTVTDEDLTRLMAEAAAVIRGCP
jgi:hypothetical protein